MCKADHGILYLFNQTQKQYSQTMSTGKIEPSYLRTCVGQTKFLRRAELGADRPSDNALLKYQEPIGYQYFTPSNVQAILDGVPEGKSLSFNDIAQSMERIFHASGTREAYRKTLDPEDTKEINRRVLAMNALTRVEISKNLGSRRSVLGRYTRLLTEPNVAAKLNIPKQTSVKATQIIGMRRYIDVPQPQQKYKFESLSCKMPEAPPLYDLS
jgi:hypothetical protein